MKVKGQFRSDTLCYPWSTDLDGVIPNVVFTLMLQFSCSYLPLICLSTNQNIQLIHSLLIRIEWTTGNGILMSSQHWPIYNKLYPDVTFMARQSSCPKLSGWPSAQSDHSAVVFMWGQNQVPGL